MKVYVENSPVVRCAKNISIHLSDWTKRFNVAVFVYFQCTSFCLSVLLTTRT